MLLMGMKISFTKKPTNPITTKPIATRNATLVNSAPNNAKSKPSSNFSRVDAEVYVQISSCMYM